MEGKVRYQKELQKTYLIAVDCKKELIESFCGKTVFRNDIRGLTKCEMRYMDAQREVWYQISSLHSLEQIFAVKQMCFTDIKNIIFQLTEMIRETEKFLLDGRQICFEPEYVYMDMETGQMRFLYDYTEEHTESGLCRLAEFILERTCHEEEKAVELAYFFYECAEKENFSIDLMEDHLEKTEEKVEKLCDRETGEFFQKQEEYEKKERENFELIVEEKNKEGNQKNSISWNNGNGKIIETGLTFIVTAVLSGIVQYVVQKSFILEASEKVIWIILSFLLFLLGLFILTYGFYREKRKTKGKKGKDQFESATEVKTQKTEIQLQKCHEEPVFMETKEETKSAGKTVYIGKSVLNREYNLVEIKKGKEKEYPVSAYPFVIGKEKGSVHLEIKEHSVSRIHARLLEINGDIYLEDLHSTNGTYLNDLPLTPHDKLKLKRGDIVQFGKAEFIFR